MGVTRKTKYVKYVLEAFTNSNNARSIVDLVKQFDNKMNKTTVYRILDRLEDESVLHSFTGKDGLKWVAKSEQENKALLKSNHPHFQCKSCGKSECISIEVPIPEVSNYKIDSVNLILIGQCDSCKL